MKILTLVSSYRKNGNTAKIIQQVQEKMLDLADSQHVPLEFETIFLGHQNLHPCRGCRVCFDRGEQFCPLKDDLLEIKSKMKRADGLIIASPVYVGDVNGIMKNWIDRMAHVSHRPEFAEKCVYLVATTGTSPTKHTIRTLQGAFLSWGAYLVGWSGFKMGAKMDSITAKIRYQNECSKIARHLFLAVQNRRFIKPSIFSLMVFKTQQWFYRRLKDDSVDYSYWHRNGWTDPNQEFFIPHQSNRLTVTFARLMGTLLAVFWA